MANKQGIIFLEQGWTTITMAFENALKTIPFKKSKTLQEWKTVWDTCYDMCTQGSPYNWAPELYQRHGEMIENYLMMTVLPALHDKTGQGLLIELRHRWTTQQTINNWLKTSFSYLDRYYTKQKGLPRLSYVGPHCFRTKIYDEMKTKTTTAILDLINDEREGRIIDESMVKSIVEMYEAMGMGSLDAYKSDLEVPLLKSTREYYGKKCEEWINEDSTQEYLIKAEEALNQERARVADYLNSSTEGELLKVVEEEFLKPRAKIVQNNIASEGDKVIKAHQARLAVGDKDKNGDPKFVKELIELHEKYLGVVKTDFSGHSLFQKALKDAFVEIVNKDVGAELMSTYCDRILKSGGEKLSEQEVEESLDRIVQLFSYLTDKDLFDDIYRHQLAKRLLNQRSTGNDAEKLMIAKLKMQCGTQFTSKMECMLNDLAIGNEQRSEFERKMTSMNASLEFSVQVLTTGSWPTYKSPQVTLTPEMTRCLDACKDWYNQKHQKRKLTWIFSQGSAVVGATYGKKSYDFQLSTLQAVALNAFNAGATLTFAALLEALKLEAEILKSVMHSLCCGKYKLVNKSPPGNKINVKDTFTANAEFTSSKRKIRTPGASLDSIHSNKRQRLEEDRSSAIEAAIVRIMKARKTLPHQELIAEVLALLALFKPNPRAIKKRIEALIDREYLERSEDSSNVYNYLA